MELQRDIYLILLNTTMASENIKFLKTFSTICNKNTHEYFNDGAFGFETNFAVHKIRLSITTFSL